MAHSKPWYDSATQRPSRQELGSREPQDKGGVGPGLQYRKHPTQRQRAVKFGQLTRSLTPRPICRNPRLFISGP